MIHQKGFYQTTLAHIADKADVLLGNVYYYFGSGRQGQNPTGESPVMAITRFQPSSDTTAWEGNNPRIAWRISLSCLEYTQ